MIAIVVVFSFLIWLYCSSKELERYVDSRGERDRLHLHVSELQQQLSIVQVRCSETIGCLHLLISAVCIMVCVSSIQAVCVVCRLCVEYMLYVVYLCCWENP